VGFQAGTVIVVTGAVILVLVLLAFPVVIGLSTAALAAVLGELLHRDGRARHAGSELLDLNS
jgi:hypothetical protein